MKRLILFVSLLVAPLAALAQSAVFTDNFSTGSTLNGTSTPGGTPTASSTSYDIAASKPATTNCTIGPGKLRLALDKTTTGGFFEAQAVFTGTPVSLVTVGDYINLTYVFTNTTGTLLAGGPGSYITHGFYNSGGVPPVAGSLANSGLAGAGFGTGNCANWQGYASRISNLGTNEAYTRPLQNGPGTAASNQELLFNGSGTDSYTNPPGPVIDTEENLNSVSLTSGGTYTVSYSVALTAAGTVTISNFLYSGAGTGGSLLFSQTNTATGTNVVATSFDGFSIGVRNSGATFIPLMEISSISIAKSIFGAPGPSFDVTGGGTGCPAPVTNFPVGLSGSVSTNDYYLYTNGVWTGILQTGNGSALTLATEQVLSVPLTNTVIASNNSVGGPGFTGPMSGSVLVAPEPLPLVTNQPSSLTAANGSTAFFSVGASIGGLGTLHYQWFRNGTALADVNEFSGTLTPTLIIQPVNPGDAATVAQGYYCMIANDCGLSTNSITNSLTVDSAANLTWHGGNPNTNWDLATTANFTNGASQVVFNSGDNVTFDDSSTVPVLSIVGNFIIPTMITDSATTQIYTFNGPGVINGLAALQMTGGSKLIIVNSNAYSGGTTISSGTIVASNAVLSSLGTGPVTLSGGTLDIPIKGSTSLGFSNIINVTANTSTLQYDQSGTEACILSGPLTGNSAANLNIKSANSGNNIARLRFYSEFTNNANLVLSLGATEIEIAAYVSTNSDGTPRNQFFNGTVSGTGGRIVPRAAGSIILNNAGNTFIDQSPIAPTTPGYYSVLMSGGNIGIGADSVPTTPPTLTSGPLGIGIVAINANTNSEGGNCSFFAYGGAHTIANQFIYTTPTNDVTVAFKGSNTLTLTGEFDLANQNDPNGAQRTLAVSNTAPTILAGVINDNNAINTANFGTPTPCGITKTGRGALYLNATNIYSGPTTNNSGLLAGSGSIAGPVIIGTNGTSASIGGGSADTIGTLTISNSLTLNDSSGVFIRVNKGAGQASDEIFVTGGLTNNGTGTVTVVTNGGSALAPGDTFQVFNEAMTGGSALTVTGAGVTWTNKLGLDGSIAVLTASIAAPTTNASITKVSLSGTNLLVHGTNNNVPNTSFHYAVLTATNIATPLSNWTSVITNPFNANGTFDYTNPIVPGTPRQFIDVKAVP